MAFPKIVWVDDTSTENELLFTYPPVQKPASDDREGTRHDSISISGLKQSVLERIDVFKNLQMDFVPTDDAVAWEAFMEFALGGGTFDYYPDADVVHFTTYTLEDTDWKPKRNFHLIDKFTLRLRKVVGAEQTGS